MLSLDDNQLVCRVGPGTPMGELMRQYWIPGMLSSELPEPDCDPIRVMLLGEQLVAWRDSDGRPGIMGNYCPHRGASMFYGRNEEGGLRCVYHGWKFDVDGNCTDMMNEPVESNYAPKVRANAYPCRERNGCIWVYMGPEAMPPPLPDIEASMSAGYHTLAIEHDHNWLQVLEGTIDTIHAGMLHSGSQRWQDQPEGTFRQAVLKDRTAKFEVSNFEVGMFYGAHRPYGDNEEYWRIACFLLPFYGMSPTGGSFEKNTPTTLTAAVPMDDEHTLYVHFIAENALDNYELLPRTTDWYGRFNAPANTSNDYLMDRAVQRRSKLNSGEGPSYTGIPGGRAQDRAITSSMGTIYDRTHEHLGQTDLGIIRTRRILLDTAKKFAADGQTPPGVHNPEYYRVRTGEVFLPEGANWLEETKELRKSPPMEPKVLATV